MFRRVVGVLLVFGLAASACGGGDSGEGVEPEPDGVGLSGEVSLSGLDLGRLAVAVESLDPDAVCPDVVSPSSFDGVAEVGRIEGGCALVEYVALEGRSMDEVSDELAGDPSVFAVGFPAVDLVAEQAQQPPFGQDGYGVGDRWHWEDLGANYLWDPDGWGYVGDDGIARRVPGWPEGASVVVAVIDDGVDGSHRDLDPNVLWAGDGCHRDPNGDHGTHVAGLVAAVQGNGVDVAGLAPQAKILAVKVHFSEDFDDWKKKTNPADEDCYDDVSTLTQAIDYARTRGVDVINLSLRWSKERDYGVVRDREGFLGALGQRWVGSDTVEWAIEVARLQGIVVVAAAGNCGDNSVWTSSRTNINQEGWKHNDCTSHNQQQRPASYAGVISVASTDSNGARAAFSTANADVDIAAPGKDVLSTVPGGTGYKSGTSMASPIVAAVVAHIKARFPFLTPDEIADALQTTASTHPRRTNGLGYGIINPKAAIEHLDRTHTDDTVEPELPSQIPVVGDGEGGVAVVAGASAQGWTGCTSPNCRHLEVSLGDQAPGSYTIECWSSLDETVPWYTGTWHWPTSPLWTEGGCWFGYPGEQVWVTINGQKSNTITWPNDIPADTPSTYSAISIGDVLRCALRTDGTITCWSWSEPHEFESDGVLPGVSRSFEALSTNGAYHFILCGLSANGTLSCSEDAPSGIFTDVSVGTDYSCGVRSDGTITCWSHFGDGNPSGAPIGTFTQVSVGDRWQACGVRNDGTITCWEIIDDGALLEAPVGMFADVSVGFGFAHACGLRSDAKISCWGLYAYSDQLKAPDGTFTDVSVGRFGLHACGVRSHGTITCWGDVGWLDEYGWSLSNNDMQADVPEGRYSAVAAGGRQICGLHSDATLTCWGTLNDMSGVAG